jgi:hypothetical protein
MQTSHRAGRSDYQVLVSEHESYPLRVPSSIEALTVLRSRKGRFCVCGLAKDIGQADAPEEPRPFTRTACNNQAREL